MIEYLNKKLTPTELAKAILVDAAETRADWWEKYLNNFDYLDKMTLTEKDKVQKAIDKQIMRIINFMAIDGNGNKNE